MVKKFGTGSCSNDNVAAFTAPKGGQATVLRIGCLALYVTGKLKVPVTPPIGSLPSLTLPINEEQCRTWTSDVGFGIGGLNERVLYVKRNESTNECTFSPDP